VLFAKYNQNDQLMENEMDRHVALMREKLNAYRILMGKPEGKRTPENPRLRLVDNIKIYHRYKGLGGMDWIFLAQDKDR
jgi:hypothetical protein